MSPVGPIRPVEGRSDLPPVEPVILPPADREQRRREREEKRRRLAAGKPSVPGAKTPPRDRADGGPGLDLRV